MDHLVDVEDSYAHRRQLFKNIWDTAMNINDNKDADIMNKPKVIKTLKLNEVDRCYINKRKKTKLKNLRTVCNKILDFCDKQEADDLFYEQMNSESHGPKQHVLDLKPKKTKTHRLKKKDRFKRLYPGPKKDGDPTANATSNLPESKSTKHIKKTVPKKRLSESLKSNSSDDAWKYYYVIKPVEMVQRPINSPTKKLLQVHKINLHEALL